MVGGIIVRTRTLVAIGLMVMVSACNKKAEGQTVAIVNGEEITAAELNAELANARIPEGADKDQVRTRILQSMIDRRLVAQQAKKDGIDKSPEFLNRQRRLTEDLLLNMYASRQIDTAQLPSPQEVQRYEASRPEMFAKREQWNLDQVRFRTPTSEAVKKQLSDAMSMDAVIKVLTDAGIEFTRQKNRLDTAVVPHDLYGKLASSKPGEPFIIPVGDQMVASVVTSREAAPLAGDKARPIAVAAIRREQAAKVMQDRLKGLRETAKIEYKEGYAPAKK